MKLSSKKKQELYNAIGGQIMDLRVEITMNPNLADEDKLDERLFKLTSDIWVDVKRALKLNDVANDAAMLLLIKY